MNIQATVPEPILQIFARIGDPLYAVEMPRPLSVNRLFHNNKKWPNGNTREKGRSRTKSYDNWIKDGGKLLLGQGPRPALSGPVAILFELGEDSPEVNTRLDTDNVSKAYLDLLCKMSILPDDNRRVIKHLQITWVPGHRFLCHVHRWIDG